MKKILIPLSVAVLFLSLSFSGAATAHAVVKAYFPDPARLQPPPAGIAPNIAHNIQSTGTLAPDLLPQPAETPTAPAAPVTPPASHSNLLWWIIGILAFGAIIGIIVRVTRTEE